MYTRALNIKSTPRSLYSRRTSSGLIYRHLRNSMNPIRFPSSHSLWFNHDWYEEGVCWKGSAIVGGVSIMKPINVVSGKAIRTALQCIFLCVVWVAESVTGSGRLHPLSPVGLNFATYAQH